MNLNLNKRNKKIISILFLVVLIAAAFLIKTKLFEQDEKIINSTRIAEIKADFNGSGKFIKLTNIEGSSDYIVMTFKDEQHTGMLNTFYSLYDVHKQRDLKYINYQDENVNIRDASIVKYIGDNKFIIISSFGEIFIFNPAQKEPLQKVDSSGILKVNMFDHIINDKYLYILARETYNNANEYYAGNAEVYEIKLDDLEKKDFNLKKHSVDKDSIAYSLVRHQDGRVGIIGSSVVNVAAGFMQSYENNTDDFKLSEIPTFNGEYRLPNVDEVWVKFIGEEKKMVLPSSLLDVRYPLSFEAVNLKLNTTVGIPYNLPVYIGDNGMLMKGISYIEQLLDKPIDESSKLIGVRFDNNVTIDLNQFINGDLENYSYKKYKLLFKNAEGVIGINKNGEFKKVLDYPLVYSDKKNTLYEYNNAIYLR